MSGGVGTMGKEVYVEGFSKDISDADLKRIISKEAHDPLFIKLKPGTDEFRRRHAVV